MALVELAIFHDPVSAAIVRGRLASEGVETILFGAGLASLGLGTMSPVRLMVEEEHRAQAERILAS